MTESLFDTNFTSENEPKPESTTENQSIAATGSEEPSSSTTATTPATGATTGAGAGNFPALLPMMVLLVPPLNHLVQTHQLINLHHCLHYKINPMLMP